MARSHAHEEVPRSEGDLHILWDEQDGSARRLLGSWKSLRRGVVSSPLGGRERCRVGAEQRVGDQVGRCDLSGVGLSG
jgi:hypothetical protein